MVLLPCSRCCKNPAFGAVLTGFSRALSGFNLASGLSRSYESAANRFWVTGSYDDSAGGDGRLKIIAPGRPTVLRNTLGTPSALPQEVSPGSWPDMIQLPGEVAGFAAPNQASVSFRADGTAIEMRLLLYLKLPHTDTFAPQKYQTQQVQVVYRKANQFQFFDSAEPDTKIVFSPSDIQSFSATALDSGAPTLTLEQSDVGTVTVGCIGALDSMYGDFVVTVTAQTPSYSFEDFAPPKTIAFSAAGFSGTPFQINTTAAIATGGGFTVGNCTKWAVKTNWSFVSNSPTQFLLYVLFGGASDTWATVYEPQCVWASGGFNAGITMVAFALLKAGNTMTVTLPAPYWSDNGRTYWHASPGFGHFGSVLLTESDFEDASGPIISLPRQGLAFRHGTATLTVARP